MDKRTEYVETLSAQMVEWEDLKTGTEQIWGDFTTMLGKAITKIK